MKTAKVKNKIEQSLFMMIIIMDDERTTKTISQPITERAVRNG